MTDGVTAPSSPAAPRPGAPPPGRHVMETQTSEAAGQSEAAAGGKRSAGGGGDSRQPRRAQGKGRGSEGGAPRRRESPALHSGHPFGPARCQVLVSGRALRQPGDALAGSSP